jgi:hypothetical protein
MQRCVRCGVPHAAPICWHCGHQTAIDSPQPAAADRTRVQDAPVSNPLPIAVPAAVTRRNRSLLLFGAAGLFIALSVVIAAGRLSRPAVESVGTVQATPVASRASDPPVRVEPTLLPTWVGRRDAVWGPDGTKTVSFALDAISDVTAGSRTRPQLVARCLARATEVYVVTGPLSFERQTGTHTVRVRVDDEPEQSQQWVDSDGSRELFASDAVALSDRLARAQRLRIGFTPFNASPVTAEFIVEGFDQIAPVLARTCGRRPLPPPR